MINLFKITRTCWIAMLTGMIGLTLGSLAFQSRGFMAGGYARLLAAAVVLALIAVTIKKWDMSHLHRSRRGVINTVALLSVTIVMSFVVVLTNLDNVTVKSPWTVAGSLLFLSLTIGLFEELLFRYWLIGSLIRYGSFTAIVASSLAFGLLHAQGLSLGAFLNCAPQIGMGMIFAVMYLLSGRLWVPIVMHALWDFAIFLRLYLFVGSSSTVSKGVSASNDVVFSPAAFIMGCVYAFFAVAVWHFNQPTISRVHVWSTILHRRVMRGRDLTATEQV